MENTSNNIWTVPRRNNWRMVRPIQRRNTNTIPLIEKLFQRLYREENIIRVTKANQLRWAKYVVRSEDQRLINIIYNGRPAGWRSVSKRRQPWKDAVTSDLNK